MPLLNESFEEFFFAVTIDSKFCTIPRTCTYFCQSRVKKLVFI